MTKCPLYRPYAAYIYIYIHTCIYIHTYTYTCIYIHTQINGAFLKIEIKSGILSKDIVNPFADTLPGAQDDSDDDGKDGSSEALNISDIRVRASVSLLCNDPSQLPSQNTGLQDQTRMPQWNTVMFYDLCDASEVWHVSVRRLGALIGHVQWWWCHMSATLFPQIF